MYANNTWDNAAPGTATKDLDGKASTVENASTGVLHVLQPAVGHGWSPRETDKDSPDYVPPHKRGEKRVIPASEGNVVKDTDSGESDEKRQKMDMEW